MTDTMNTATALPRDEAYLATVRRAFARFPSGVVGLVAVVDGHEIGMVASSFTVGVSADPPLVSVAVQKTSTSWPRLRAAASIGVSVFADDQAALARQIAGPDRNRRFDGVTLLSTRSDARFVDGASTWFECTVHDEVDAGDHTVALLEVVALRTEEDRLPLVFHDSGFRQLAP